MPTYGKMEVSSCSSHSQRLEIVRSTGGPLPSLVGAPLLEGGGVGAEVLGGRGGIDFISAEYTRRHQIQVYSLFYLF
jgi:hypothetical protein